MIRSSKHILKYQTYNKNNMLDKIFEDFKIDLQLYIDLIITGQLDLTLNLSPKVLPINKIAHANWRQIIYKTASEIIRSQIKKANSKRYARYKRIYAKYKHKNIHVSFLEKRFSDLKLKPILQSKYFTRPDLKNITITLDCRLIDFQQGNYFDEFVRIKTPYFHENKKRAITICLPIKHHKHSLKYKDWQRKNSIRLTQKGKNKFLEFIYEKKEPAKRSTGTELGIDQGYKKLISDSNGKFYGEDLFKLYQQLNNKKQGSKKFKKLLQFRSDETNRVINEFFKQNKQLRTLYIEDLKNVKKSSNIHRKVMNKVQRWLYSQVTGKLERYCQENGIQLIKVNPAYTSQTCSKCGIVDKNSRNGEWFHCQHCGYELDADFNAAKNILSLGVMYPKIPKTN